MRTALLLIVGGLLRLAAAAGAAGLALRGLLLGRAALGRTALGRAALGRAALGRTALGRAALGRAALRSTAALGNHLIEYVGGRLERTQKTSIKSIVTSRAEKQKTNICMGNTLSIIRLNSCSVSFVRGNCDENIRKSIECVGMANIAPPLEFIQGFAIS